MTATVAEDEREGTDAPGPALLPGKELLPGKGILPEKEPGAFRTIGEVAEDLDLPQHVLRFWETRFSQVRPLKRSGNRRYYRPDDVDLLRGIRRLLYGQGYTIRGAQRVLRERGMRFVQAVGRGEQVAPAFVETDHDPEPETAPPPLARADRERLNAVLDELRACRRQLSIFRRAREPNEDE